ncbi:MAG: twin-arginine translocase subunit TatC [Bacteroidetes bacterium]|nr:twin-arginine translocase subunit TatC [Bacteroidota bacterium]
MSFLDHVEVLRWHLMRSVIVVVVAAIVLFLNNEFLFGTVIFGPKKPDFLTYQLMCKFSYWIGAGESMCIREIPFSLINTSLSGQFTTHMWVSFLGGVIIAFPYILWELWRFIKPALHEKEQKSTTGFVFFASILFIIGVLFSYYLIVPLTINFLGSYQVSSDVLNTISMDSYISTLTTLTIATGLVFELPIVVYFLTKFGILTPAFMKQYRRHAVVVILIVAAVITPSPDISSQVLVAIPLYMLYELSIFVSRYVISQKTSVK